MFSKIFNNKIFVKFKNRQIIVEFEENELIANFNFNHNSDENSSNIDHASKQQLITTNQSFFDVFIIKSILLIDHQANFDFIILQQKQLCDMIRNILKINLQFMINNMFYSIIQTIFAQIRIFVFALIFFDFFVRRRRFFVRFFQSYKILLLFD